MPEMISVLASWQQAGWIRRLDYSLAQFLQREAPQDSPLVWLAVALTSYQLGRGHVCLEWNKLLADAKHYLQLNTDRSQTDILPALTPQQLLANVSKTQLLTALTQSSAVSTAEHAVKVTPLVLEGNRLYLRRYWQYEQQIRHALLQRIQTPVQTDNALLQSTLQTLFGPSSPQQVNWQKLACANTVRHRFSIITGGPGTGKTYTVVRLLALLHTLAAGQPLRIALAAPTGKAAARLTESIRNEFRQLQQTEIPVTALQAIAAEAKTLHRLLGVTRDGFGFRHHADNPLPLDWLIIDEASMIDIDLMSALISALAPETALVLLGDKDQLASVEAGAILGQLCQGAEQGGYTPATVDWLQQVTGEKLPETCCQPESPLLLQGITMLRHSRRFDGKSGIGELAKDVNNRHSRRIADWLKGATSDAAALAHFSDLQLLQPLSVQDNDFRQLIMQGFQPYLTAIAQRPQQADDALLEQWARTVLQIYGQFQLLCCVREGDWGVQALNEQVQRWLQPELSGKPFSARKTAWYSGRPVMVTQNDYSLDLRNGDIGICLQRHEDEPLRVVFPDAGNRLRWILPSRLTHTETVYAMTVHKAQGSEFLHTVLVLPDTDSAVLSKELLYTGITRARKKFSLIAANSVVVLAAVKRNTERSGGLYFPE